MNPTPKAAAIAEEIVKYFGQDYGLPISAMELAPAIDKHVRPLVEALGEARQAIIHYSQNPDEAIAVKCAALANVRSKTPEERMEEECMTCGMNRGYHNAETNQCPLRSDHGLRMIVAWHSTTFTSISTKGGDAECAAPAESPLEPVSSIIQSAASNAAGDESNPRSLPQVIPATEELKAKMQRLAQQPPVSFEKAKAQVDATGTVQPAPGADEGATVEKALGIIASIVCEGESPTPMEVVKGVEKQGAELLQSERRLAAALAENERLTKYGAGLKLAVEGYDEQNKELRAELAAKMSRDEYREFIEELSTHLRFRLDAIEEEEED